MPGKKGPMLTGVIDLAAGEAITIPSSLGAVLHIITGSGATASYSKVDSSDASAHDTPTTLTLAADSEVTVTVAWPFYRVSTAGGAVRVALV